jgi:tRNA (mo5U34)-methyltransferase
MTPMDSQPAAAPTFAEEVAANSWYHSIELPDGVVTAGVFDTIGEREHVPLPASLEGKRCLDVGTADGFWAFEMEKRGASEVVAVDVPDRSALDWPAQVDQQEWDVVEPLAEHRGFELARRALGSDVKLEERRVYDLNKNDLGEFDFAFMGSLLLHLRDPVGALEAVRRVVRGELLSVDTISPLLTALHPRQPVARLEAPGWPLWWLVNLAGYRHMFGVAGWEIVDSGKPFFLKRGSNYRHTPRSERPFYGRFQDAAAQRLGVMHSWVLARPQP